MTLELSNDNLQRVTAFDAPALAELVAASRPKAIASLEQFHMTPTSLVEQFEALSQRFANRTVVMLGDDDHLSVLLAAFTDATIRVVDIDERVTNSLDTWSAKLPLPNLTAVHADIRDAAQLRHRFDRPADVFYVNPPFSSKNNGHGIRAWITAALLLCDERCDGVVVMPADHLELGWVNRNWLSIQSFLSANGLRVTSLGGARQSYADQNLSGLRSCNLHVSRVFASLQAPEIANPDASLYR